MRDPLARARMLPLVLLLTVALSACSSFAWRSSKPTIVTFVDKVWRVGRPSDIAEGSFYIFLSDGTLLVKTATAPPLIGTWSINDGSFTMVEQGIVYQVDILALTPDEFSIRSRNPGPPVKIRLVTADAPPSTEPTPGETPEDGSK